MSEPQRVVAAQYLRMSTEHQRYSLANQADAIRDYADARGYELNRTYLDPGRSGLTLRDRPGLQALLADALKTDRGFEAILVLDVSRWGRFQDPDQAAHYEFLCREAGVELVYCAEPFENDGSSAAVLVKQLKRLMAAEYSRELSSKVIRAQLKLATLGFHQGGTRVYGVDRLVLDAQGRPRFLLKPGDRKAVVTDRVILVPGPPEEIAVVRRIFRDFLDRRPLTEIAAELTEQGVASARNGPWSAELVRRVLTNELMVGVYVYNRTRTQLGMRRRLNPPDQWVRVRMEPLVSPKLFSAAASLLGDRSRERLSRRAMLHTLRRLLRERDHLTLELIKACPYTAGIGSYVKYFGSVSAAYAKIGYVPKRVRWAARPSDFGASNDELLRLLRDAHHRHGHLCRELISDDPDLPSSDLYGARFGSVSRAYKLAGLPYAPSELARLAYQRSVARGTAAIGVAKRRTVYDPDHLLAVLRDLYARHGYVSARLFKADLKLPPLRAYARTFGSLLKAYEAAGLPSDLHTVLVAGARRRLERVAQRRKALALRDAVAPTSASATAPT